MILLTIGAILLTLFIFFIIGFITFMMFVDKATPQIYYTPCESVTVKTKGKHRRKKKLNVSFSSFFYYIPERTNNNNPNKKLVKERKPIHMENTRLFPHSRQKVIKPKIQRKTKWVGIGTH